MNPDLAMGDELLKKTGWPRTARADPPVFAYESNELPRSQAGLPLCVTLCHNEPGRNA